MPTFLEIARRKAREEVQPFDNCWKAVELNNQAILLSNNWHRIGNDLWRNEITTEELSTEEALEACQIDELVKELEKQGAESGEVRESSQQSANCAHVSEIADYIIEEKPKPEIKIDEDLKRQLKKQFCFITGRAGTGKSTSLRLMSELEPSYIELGSTTGISAVNVGGRTVNSLLKYFNTESLEIAYHNGRLHNRLRLIRDRKRVLGIEEISMMDAKQLDIIYDAIQDININDDAKPLGLHILGDFLQLPPIKAEFAFKANCWSEFEDNTMKLNKVWRQENLDFLLAVNLIREGKGKEAVSALKHCGIEFRNQLDPNFSGTTLIPHNKDVDNFNAKRLTENRSPMIRISPLRRGTQMKEWDNNIPYEQRFKIGAYVTILRNDFIDWKYVNGDSGTIERFDKSSETFYIKLVRTGETVAIGMIKQLNLQDEQPTEGQFNSMFYPTQDAISGQWCIGYIEFIPLKLAWASTIHRSQGLTLDLVQIDSRPSFYGYPSMCYVAVSRSRTPEGLIIVGSSADFANKVKTDKQLMRFI